MFLTVFAQENSKEGQSVFLKLLKEHKAYPQLIKLSKTKVKDVSAAEISSLPKSVAEARYKQFNAIYLRNKSKQKRVVENLARLQKLFDQEKKDQTKIADFYQKIQKLKKMKAQLAELLFSLSLQAHGSYAEATQYFSKSSSSKSELRDEEKRPKLPGQYMGSRKQREKQTKKYLLTPFDGDIDTQLNKKIKADIPRPVDYWSYDYDLNEMYLMDRGGKTYKLQVNKDAADRILVTKTGRRFQEPVGSALRLNTVNLKGSFYKLEGSNKGAKAERSLIGMYPGESLEVLVEEVNKGHEGHDHHDHDGHNHD